VDMRRCSNFTGIHAEGTHAGRGVRMERVQRMWFNPNRAVLVGERCCGYAQGTPPKRVFLAEFRWSGTARTDRYCAKKLSVVGGGQSEKGRRNVVLDHVCAESRRGGGVGTTAGRQTPGVITGNLFWFAEAGRGTGRGPTGRGDLLFFSSGILCAGGRVNRRREQRGKFFLASAFLFVADFFPPPYYLSLGWRFAGGGKVVHKIFIGAVPGTDTFPKKVAAGICWRLLGVIG